MSGDNYDLFRMLGAFDVADDIEAGRIRQRLWSQDELHSHGSLRDERCDQIGVFGGNSARGNLRQIFFVIGVAGMRQAIIRASDRTNQASNGAETSGGGGSIASIFDGLAVGFSGPALRGHFLSELIIEENYFARDLLLAEVIVARDNDLGR